MSTNKMIVISVALICMTFLIYQLFLTPYAKCVRGITGYDSYGSVLTNKDAKEICTKKMFLKM